MKNYEKYYQEAEQSISHIKVDHKKYANLWYDNSYKVWVIDYQNETYRLTGVPSRRPSSARVKRFLDAASKKSGIDKATLKKIIDEGDSIKLKDVSLGIKDFMMSKFNVDEYKLNTYYIHETKDKIAFIKDIISKDGVWINK